MKLSTYKEKRNFRKTAEPRGTVGPRSSHLYLIQKHAASRLHYDFRLALDGVLKSWAVPKGPSLNPGDKRLAVHVEDHPLDYGSFEGTIPQGEYGGGTVMMWDRGEWLPEGDPERGYAKGHLRFQLKGQRLKGRWSLIRMGGRAGEEGKNWLLVKEADDVADEKKNIVEQFQTSMITRRSMDEIAAGRKKWHSDRPSGRAFAPKAARAKPARQHPPLSLAARKAPFPSSLKPQLATLAKEVPSGKEWIHEVKYDGYRLIAFIHDGRVRLMTRNEQDWTSHFPTIAKALATLSVKSAVLDGEVVVQKADGTTDFQALQNDLHDGKSSRLTYFVFDLPYCQGHDLGLLPLIERKTLLKEILGPEAADASATVRYSDHIAGDGRAVFKNACHYALEGILSKRADGAYHQRRSPDWLKIKCSHRQEFIIAGYTRPKGSRLHFGSLLLGYYDDKGKLVYAGHVGTGFNDKLLATLMEELKRRRQTDSPFHARLESQLRRDVIWVKPELVGEVEFAGWTNDGVLRHPSFQGLREDKKAREVVRETAAPSVPAPEPPAAERPRRVERAKAPSTGNSVAGVTITHPDRILYSGEKFTKLDVCRYYDSVATWMLPHIKGRPVSLLRCPAGEGKACFFQKHLGETTPDAIRGIEIAEKETKGTYILIDDAKGLVSLAQMGVMEFHPWPANEKNIERPDRLVLDLDPAPGVSLKKLVEAARRVRDTLADLGLTSFVKTTGGKGLHVVAPVRPTVGWEEFKAFAAGVAANLVRKHPDDYVDTMSKSHRTGKIFIDYFRNGRGATSVAPYSTRARKGATVSMPLAWDELTVDLNLDAFTIASVPGRLANGGEAWRGFFELKQAITREMLGKYK